MAWAKCEHLILLVAYWDNLTSDIDFTDEAVVKCDVLIVKILF